MSFLIQSIDDWASQLKKAAEKPHKNEAELRHALYLVLHGYCTEYVGISDVDIRHEGTSSAGRFDSLFGTALIEYKSPHELDTRSQRSKHAKQALNYLDDEDIDASVVLITDGIHWGILRDPDSPRDNSVASGALLEAIPAADKFQWRENAQDTCKRVLELMDTVRFDKVAPHSLSVRFGPTTSAGRCLIQDLVGSLRSREEGSRSEILFRQWIALAGVSYGIETADTDWPDDPVKLLGDIAPSFSDATYAETLFSLHTYMAICCKLIASEMLALNRGFSDLRPSQWTAFSAKKFVNHVKLLEDGGLSVELGAPGLLGGDLFCWYAEHMKPSSPLTASLRSLVASFSQLGWAKVAHADQNTGDLLREFYINVMPRYLRKALGEFFTPQWIADRVLSKAVELHQASSKDSPRFLDPTCGSGAFLVAAMRFIIQADRASGVVESEIAQNALRQVVGFDINPVSALMSKVNIVLTLGSLSEQLPELLVNVFQADSILIPEEPSGQTSLDQIDSAVSVPLVIGSIELPNALATLPGVSVLSRFVDKYVKENRPVDLFEKRIDKEFRGLGLVDSELEISRDAAVKIYQRLLLLHAEGRNGVWAHVIEQSFAPRVLGDVDIVIGNPPWISWKNLPKAWRERSRPTWEQWGLWQTTRSGTGTPMGDISTLLLARSIATYAPEGIVALLLPQGILINDPGNRAIRKCKLGVNEKSEHFFNPIYVDDFTELNPFPGAATNPVALYVRPGERPTFPVDGTYWSRAAARTKLDPSASFGKVQPLLSARQIQSQPIDTNDVSSRWRERSLIATEKFSGAKTIGRTYVFGQGFHSRGADGIFYCKIVSQEPIAGGLVNIRTVPGKGKNTKELPERVLSVEPDHLWPLVRGRDVNPFHVAKSNWYAIVPHDPSDLRRVLSSNELMESSPRVYDYLDAHRNLLRNRKSYNLKLTDDQPWGLQSTSSRHLRRGQHLVVVRYMEPHGRPPAAVIPPRVDKRLGITTTAFPNNKVNFLSCGSVSEADFVAAVVNSKPAQEFISALVSKTTIAPSVLNALNIPIFDSENDLHRRLSSLGRDGRLDNENWEDHLTEIDKLVMDLYA
ncbi:N-6 DNA methylase [Corynebacterium lehmanniae]